MPEQRLAVRLAPIAYPLANHFYRTHRTQMRARGHHQVLVLREDVIIGALCLQPVAHGHWLTNLLIAPEHRGRGCARQLLSEARRQVAGSIWLFCLPELESFYQGAGYQRCEQIPLPLVDRLSRYLQSKSLIAMEHTG